MTNTLLTLLLALQLSLPQGTADSAHTLACQAPQQPHPLQTWWGLIDPDLSLWFAHIPTEEDKPLLWDWSWRGFFAALFAQPLVKEDGHAPSV